MISLESMIFEWWEFWDMLTNFDCDTCKQMFQTCQDKCLDHWESFASFLHFPTSDSDETCPCPWDAGGRHLHFPRGTDTQQPSQKNSATVGQVCRNRLDGELSKVREIQCDFQEPGWAYPQRNAPVLQMFAAIYEKGDLFAGTLFKVQSLANINHDNHLRWVRQHLQWTFQVLSGVIFSDLTSFCVYMQQMGVAIGGEEKGTATTASLSSITGVEAVWWCEQGLLLITKHPTSPSMGVSIANGTSSGFPGLLSILS